MSSRAGGRPAEQSFDRLASEQDAGRFPEEPAQGIEGLAPVRQGPQHPDLPARPGVGDETAGLPRRRGAGRGGRADALFQPLCQGAETAAVGAADGAGVEEGGAPAESGGSSSGREQ